MDFKTIVENRKPISAVLFVVGIATIYFQQYQSIGIFLVLVGTMGLFWENIVTEKKKP